jgi:hypothetical protein
MYLITVAEVLAFLVIGFFLSENVLSRVYENSGILYIGNIGTVWFGLSFLLFCLYTLVRTFIFSKRSAVLHDRITSYSFWLVFAWAAYSVLVPFVKGEI